MFAYLIARRPLAPGRICSHIAPMQTKIDITLNGDERPIPAGQSVAGLIESLGLDRRKVAVERNREIVPRSQYDATMLLPRDQIEIVHFIGGG
jgi:thiamine biosynthesis protein ThiS